MLKPTWIRPLMPLMLICLIAIAFFWVASFYPLSWNSLQTYQERLVQFHHIHPILLPLLFIALYIVCAMVSFPAIFLLSLLAGYLFEQPFSTIYVTFAATVGASLLFLATRTAFGELLYKRAGPSLNKLKAGFSGNAANYLLFLRLFPLFPFWLVNLAGAFFHVRFRTFAWTTFVGMIPSVFVYAQAGRGLSLLLQHPHPLSPATFFNPALLISFIGMSFLSLMPLLFNKEKP